MKYKSLFIPTLLLALMLSACGSAPIAAPTAAPTQLPVATAVLQEPDTRTITDSAGREVTVPADAARLISLAPSTTEILFALGAGERVIAVDDFSDFPAEVGNLPRIGGLDYSYNTEQIVALEPDIVFAAAITSPEAVQQLTQLGISVVVVGTFETTFESVFDDIRLMGTVLGRTATADDTVAAMQQRLAALTDLVATANTTPRVYWEIDATDETKPYSIGPGNFIDDILTRAGGVNIFATSDNPYPQVSAEQVVAGDPQVIIMSNAAYGTTVESLLARPGWDVISAVREQRVYPIDDNLVSRPGPRIVDGLEAAARLIHPELFALP
ncbi:MAG TPA: cobalamin-binding protein [Roseiflexaceae bacterium]|nr:cobalamin-binding protein [Roseiflexaceae bacterium]